MQYQTPQFIEIEDKVIGPLTFKQFVYLAGGVGISFVLFIWLPFLLAIPLIGVIAALSLMLAFYKINNKPFVYLVEAAFKYALSGKLYIWRKEQKKPKMKEEKEEVHSSVFVPKMSDSKLRELAWSLDVHEAGATESTERQNIE